MIKSFFAKTIDMLSRRYHASIGVCVAVIVLLQYLQLQYSARQNIVAFLSIRPAVSLLNMGLLLALILTLRLLCQRWDITLIAESVLAALWTIVNYYTIMFHGSPLYISEFRNTGVALDVVSGYHIAIDHVVILLLIPILAELAVVALVCVLTKRQGRRFSGRGFLIALASDAVLIGCLFLSLFVWEAPKPRSTSSWHWLEAVSQYGYVSEIVENLDITLNPTRSVIVPDGYAPDRIEAAPGGAQDTDDETYPDIILILNETFGDLSIYSDVEADCDYLEELFRIGGAYHGVAATPFPGWGTNDSESELLMSSSMRLLSISSPFNYLRLSDENNISPARYLASLGYSTAALHCCTPGNYSRNIAYPALGFQTVLLGEEHFAYHTYGERPWLDSDNYADMIRYYNEMGDGPRFLYLLTFQNHGGYKKNDASYDTVHIPNDYGDLGGQINEYLTSLELSARSFRELTEYFSTVDRDVIICMVGDHEPVFISDLRPNREVNELEASVLTRFVPYVIWSNYDAALPGTDMERVSMFDLFPLTLRTAGLPLSAYYDTILSLHDEMPVLTANGLYMDTEGNVGAVDDTCPYYDDILQYYYMEYNALIGGDEYRAELFE